MHLVSSFSLALSACHALLKPGGLMIEKACARYNIDPSVSWMIGDKARDIEAGNSAGVPGIQIPVNSDLIDVVPQLIADHV